MNAASASDWLAACRLPGAWAHQTAWTVLDTHFENAQAFVRCWQAWRQDPYRPHMLHYVGIAPHPPHAATLSAQAGHGTDAALWQSLAAQCQGRGAGFHRILLNEGRVSLTLCVGDVLAMLKEQRLQADTVRAHYTGDPWLVQWLARHSRRGARVYMQEDSTHSAADHTARDALHSAGFVIDAPPSAATTPKPPALGAQFLPHWNISHRRTPERLARPAPARCAVVGAGISGASVAHALALRGWQVTVFDQEREPASAASGLPVGLAVPYVSADDSPRARLSRIGTRLAMQHAQQFLEDGRNWAPSGAQERRPDGTTLWHAYAAWIQPRALVRAWLSHPNITFTALAQVSALQRLGNLWQLNRPHGEPWGCFEHVVVANAMGCKTLLRPLVATESAAGWAPGVAEQLAALAPLHGTLSHGSYVQHIAGLPRTPVNGNGCFFPHVPGPHGDQWAAGSTFETDALEAADLGQQHSINLHRLRELLPELGDNLVHALDSGPVSLWSSTRCTTRDRLPLVGSADTAAHSGVWLSVGMGARGLSFAPLCAELLVAEMCAEPLPLERSLARSLHAGRLRRTKPFEAGLLPGEG